MFHNGRCGSTVLGRMLGKHKHVHWDEEIFLGPPSWAPELQSWHRWNHSQFYPTRPFQYLRSRIQRTRKTCYGFEVQFYQIRDINVPLTKFVDKVVGMGFSHFILLKRSNHLRVVTSNLVAIQRAQYHVRSGEDPKPTTVRIDIDEPHPRGLPLLELFRLYDSTFVNLRPQLHGKSVLELNYEDHILESPRVAYQMVCEFVGIEANAPSIELTRATPWPLNQIIENFDEVAAALRGTSYEWMTDET